MQVAVTRHQPDNLPTPQAGGRQVIDNRQDIGGEAAIGRMPIAIDHRDRIRLVPNMVRDVLAGGAMLKPADKVR